MGIYSIRDWELRCFKHPMFPKHRMVKSYGISHIQERSPLTEDKKIDQIVYKLYELTEEEIKIVEN